MNIRIFVLGATLSLVAACGDKTLTNEELSDSVSIDTPEVTNVSMPETFFEKMMAGETLTITLDACDPMDGQQWLEKNDPAGRLVCNTQYEISYSPKSNRIMTSGLLENVEGGEHKSRYNGREWSGKVNSINFWGSRGSLTNEGQVFKNKVLIGHVVE